MHCIDLLVWLQNVITKIARCIPKTNEPAYIMILMSLNITRTDYKIICFSMVFFDNKHRLILFFLHLFVCDYYDIRRIFRNCVENVDIHRTLYIRSAHSDGIT